VSDDFERNDLGPNWQTVYAGSGAGQLAALGQQHSWPRAFGPQYVLVEVFCECKERQNRGRGAQRAVEMPGLRQGRLVAQRAQAHLRGNRGRLRAQVVQSMQPNNLADVHRLRGARLRERIASQIIGVRL
jgi:hypothetical protein